MNNLYKQKGVAAIELTMILPFLLLITFATAEISRMIYQYNALNHITRDALRFAINDARNGDTGDVTTSLNGIDVTSTQIAIYGGLSANGTLLPNLSATSFVFTDGVGSDGEFITLTVTYNWQPMIFTSLPMFVSSNSIDLSFPLVVKYTMRAL